MEFKGDLGFLGINDVIQTLSSMGKTGKLEIVIPKKGKGELFFKNGKLIHAHSIDNVGKEALIEIISWREGSFRFIENIILPPPSIDDDTSKTILEAITGQDEFKSKEEVLDYIPEINNEIKFENFSLDKDEWRIIMTIDGNKKCYNIMEELGSEKVKFINVIEELYKKGIISLRKE
ncbi:MAG: DUF4388 domain-containing protein [Caldisericia bacterium]